ncbi:YHS domain-containing (seleno)protein [Sphingopyxis solisilvae]|uniref:YHS domain-containing (seleno)protein n=1 Tax=Sphingopyxis solisilvae TaxID=1886788 RepID=UPI0018929365|nr:YHS domain-containing (seleno)protein [Sphingopyxis solisilvae]
MRIIIAAILLALTPAATFAAPSQSSPPVSVSQEGIAIGGYDAVSYFSDGGPVVGSPAFEHRWNGAVWRFASAEARDLFSTNAEAFAPQFGGYCAWAISQNYIAPGDPKVWRIVDGRLYLNFNERAKELWEADLADAIQRGKANWPTVLEQADNR